MKAKFLAFAMMLCVCVSVLAEDGAKIQFKSKSVNIGVVTKDAPRSTAVFEFQNTGGAPLTITNVRLSCSCLTAKYPDKPVKPGAKGEIRVTYDASDKTEAEEIYKSIYVDCNGTPARVLLSVKGTYTAEKAPKKSK